MLKLEKEQNERAVNVVLDTMERLDYLMKNNTTFKQEIKVANAMARLAQTLELKLNFVFGDKGFSVGEMPDE